MVEDTVSTMDECFEDMEKVTYGSRILAKLVDDQPCDDPRYAAMCQEEMTKNRIILEEDCQTPEYVIYITISLILAQYI
jgi:hypothetical protein